MALIGKIKDLMAKRNMIKLFMLILLTEFVRGAYLNYLPIHSYKELFLSEAVVGAVGFAYFFAETMSKVGVGWILDRFSNRIVLVAGLVLSLVSLYFFKFIDTSLLLIIDGALIGLGFAPVWLVVLSYITSQPKERRSTYMGVIYGAWLVGLGVGTVSVSFLIPLIGYKCTMNLMIGIWVLCVILGWTINLSAPAGKNEDSKQPVLNTLKELGKSKYLIPGMLLQTLGITILAPILPKYLIDSNYVGLSLNGYGATLLIIGGTAVLSVVLFGVIGKYVKSERLFVFGLLFTSIGIFGIGNFKYYITVIAFGVLLAISYSAVLPSWYKILSDNVSNNNKGLMWGIFSTIEGIGRAIGPLVGGIAASYISLQFAFYISSAIILLLFVFYYYLNMKQVLS